MRSLRAEKVSGGTAQTEVAKLNPPAPEFLRGDWYADGKVDIADGVWFLNWFFLGAATPGYVAATNTSGASGFKTAREGSSPRLVARPPRREQGQ